jgi:hypothetical protein
MGTSYNPKIVTDGLVLNLDAANRKSYPGAGTSWVDLTKNKFNGTLTNSIYSSINQGAISFNGVDRYISGGDTSAVNNNYTISSWFKPTGIPSINDTAGGVIFCQSIGAAATNHGIWLSYSWANQTVIHADRVSDGIITNNNTAPQNSIIHAVGVWNGSTQSVYINGNLSTSRAYSLTPLSDSPLAYQVGRWGNPNYPRYFNGFIYSVQLYNRALTSTEVYNNFVANRGRFGV